MNRSFQKSRCITIVLKNNPLGMFAPTNPDVNCEGYEYALLEKPTKMIHGP
jgi:hypothetical protein